MCPLQTGLVAAGIWNAYLTAVDSYLTVTTHVTILTTAIDGSVDARTDTRSHGIANDNLSLVDVTHVEGGVEVVNRHIEDVRCRFTA